MDLNPHSTRKDSHGELKRLPSDPGSEVVAAADLEAARVAARAAHILASHACPPTSQQLERSQAS